MSARNERGAGIREDFNDFVNRGKVKNFFKVKKFGRHPDLGTVIEDIQMAGDIYIWNTVAEKIEMLSTDAADTLAGSGARVVKISGINEDFDFVNEYVSLSGTSDVTTVNDYLRVNRMRVSSQGLYGRTNVANAGVITASGASSTVVQGSIDNSGMPHGQSQIGRYSIAKGHYAIVNNITINVDTLTTKTADIMLFVRENAMTVAAPFGAVNMKRRWDAIAGYNSSRDDGSIYVDATSGADIWFTGSGAQISTVVDVTFDVSVYPIL